MPHLRFPFLRALAALALASVTSAQVTTSWFQRIDGASHESDYTVRVRLGPQGDAFVLLNTRASASPLVNEGRLLRIATSGATVWSVALPFAGGSFFPSDLALDPSTQDLLVTGVGYAGTPTTSKGVLRRIHPDGSTAWTRSWVDPITQQGSLTGLVVDGTGKCVAVGKSDSITVLAYDVLGQLAWSTPLAPGLLDQPDGPGLVAHDRLGGVYVVSMTPDPDTVRASFLAGRVDAQGTVLWTDVYDGPGSAFDRAYALAVDAAHRLYVAGVVSDVGGTPSVPRYRAALVQWDALGTVQWSHVANSPGEEAYQFLDVQVDPFGDVLVAGIGSGLPNDDGALLEKRASSGALVWRRTWGRDALHSEGFARIEVDDLGGIVAGGFSFQQLSSLGLESDPVVARYDVDGVQRWVETSVFAPDNRDSVRDLARGTNGDIVYVGEIADGVLSASPTDALVVRLADQSVPFCFGDGSGTACPCGNDSPPHSGRGCQNSLGTGARLVDSGSARRFSDTLVLYADGMPNSTALFVQASQSASGSGTVFADGVTCGGGTLTRLGTKAIAGGLARYPEPGDASISIRGGVLQPGTRYYQVWYRNSANFCVPGTLNLSSGLAITWGL